METTLKNPESGFNAAMDAILAPEKPHITDSKTLIEQELMLKENLRQAILDGDAAGVIIIQNVLRDMPLRIRAAEIQEIKFKLDEIAPALEQSKADEELLEGLRKVRNAELIPLLEKLEEAQLAVRKVEASLYQVDVKRQTLLESRRDLKQLLDSYIGEIQNAEFTN